MLNLFRYLIAFFTFKVADNSRQEGALQAPLGLTWGLDINEIKKELEVVSENTLDERTTNFIFNPKIKLFGFEKYELTIDEKYGLIDVTMTEYFNSDNFHIHGKGSYYDINKILSKKYGPPSSVRNPEDDSDYGADVSVSSLQKKDTNEFLKNRWSSFYNFKLGGWINVSLKNNNPHDSFLMLEYTSANAKKVIYEQVDKEKESMSEFL